MMTTLTVVASSALGNALAQDSDNPDTDTEIEPQAAGQQDDVSKALDSTATQWSFQFAWQGSTWTVSYTHLTLPTNA